MDSAPKYCGLIEEITMLFQPYKFTSKEMMTHHSAVPSVEPKPSGHHPYDRQAEASRNIMNLSPHAQSEPHLSTLGSYQVSHLVISCCVTQSYCTHSLNQSAPSIGSPLLHRLRPLLSVCSSDCSVHTHRQVADKTKSQITRVFI